MFEQIRFAFRAARVRSVDELWSYDAMDVFGERYDVPCPPDVREYYEAMFARVDAEIAAKYHEEVSPVTRNALRIQAVHDDCPEFADCLWATSLEAMDKAIAAFEASKAAAAPPLYFTAQEIERALGLSPSELAS